MPWQLAWQNWLQPSQGTRFPSSQPSPWTWCRVALKEQQPIAALQPSLHNLHSPKMSQASEMLRESLRCFHLNSTSDSIHLIHARFHLEAIATDRLAFRPDHTRRVKHPKAANFHKFSVWDRDGEAKVPPRHSKPASSWQSEEQPSCEQSERKVQHIQKGSKRVRKETIVESGYV